MTLVEVTAPSDLPEGYEFSVEVNGETKTVIVPAGGVKEGQAFEGQLKEVEEEQVVEAKAVEGEGEEDPIKTGGWGAEFCVCTQLCCKTVWWLAWCCTPLAMAQVQERLKVDCLGTPVPKGERTQAWDTVSAVFWVLFILGLVFPIFWTVLAIYTLVIVTLTRYKMRHKYSIPPSKSCGCCDGCLGDCCASYWCTCCVVTQMSVHVTPDLENARTRCCTSTGL